jgi:hypothetical protein
MSEPQSSSWEDLPALIAVQQRMIKRAGCGVKASAKTSKGTGPAVDTRSPDELLRGDRRLGEHGFALLVCGFFERPEPSGQHAEAPTRRRSSA